MALNVPVICYDLRIFPCRVSGSTRLLELAHNVEGLKTICQLMRAQAMFNGRKVKWKIYCLKAHRWPLTRKTMCSTRIAVPSAISADRTEFLQKRRQRRHRNPALNWRRDATYFTRI